MDLSRITRPSVLCQCSRCSSSLAACENEWAKLSSSYSIAAGWLSLDINRIAISSERKQIPLSSDLSLLRGCILQDITCKLCDQKLGAICDLSHGANIFWKMSKVSFREIVTMRTVDPIFKEGLVDSLLYPKQDAQNEPEANQDAVAATSSSLETPGNSSSVRQEIQNQGLNINRISSSVDTLHGTMTELKHAFTALRIELHGPNRASLEPERADGGFDMLATVLKELKCRSEEVDRLRLENEALKLKNRYLEEQATKTPYSNPYLLESSTPIRVRSPGLLNENGKRPWLEAQHSVRSNQVLDSFDEGNELSDTTSVDDIAMHSVKIPLNDVAEPDAPLEDGQATPKPSGANGKTKDQNALDAMAEAIYHTHLDPQQPANKRRRLSQPTDSRPNNPSQEPKKSGRPRGPRKSTGQTTKTTNQPETPNPAALREQDLNVSAGSQKDENTSNPTPDAAAPKSKPRGRPSRGKSGSTSGTRTARNPDVSTDAAATIEKQLIQAAASVEDSTNVDVLDSHDQNSRETLDNPNPSQKSGKEDARERRKAQVAARDVLAKMAMQREEAMTEE
ncbi:hypothetical protein C8Q69DRAFT_505183 [Paecilomyces variotii]|uniref:Mis18 domain-containing protein n=1 Tax=Byssochlamys spectabilis TaxID=264951 RepID=A0A443I3E0_BYSSP|nr:hypothetical protein C8Q69DRAFT_505183 [Paecilomyces variotii]KAJ9253899.1 hypothetical protein DTO195F2_6876 [Paecilomyces variotii]KAJ9303843.1 hypothetical protein DTO217A2_6653 [Paecilomyces variotii]KAJ9354699.1 hypothetical protein DTO280E4_6764 [Paecilomyces variotii]RWQ98555.1 hypothetical protein C8Q69DRAFT_505183 [Paecilomyces variotii]